MARLLLHCGMQSATMGACLTEATCTAAPEYVSCVGAPCLFTSRGDSQILLYKHCPSIPYGGNHVVSHVPQMSAAQNTLTQAYQSKHPLSISGAGARDPTGPCCALALGLTLNPEFYTTEPQTQLCRCTGASQHCRPAVLPGGHHRGLLRSGTPLPRRIDCTFRRDSCALELLAGRVIAAVFRRLISRTGWDRFDLIVTVIKPSHPSMKLRGSGLIHLGQSCLRV